MHLTPRQVTYQHIPRVQGHALSSRVNVSLPLLSRPNCTHIRHYLVWPIERPHGAKGEDTLVISKPSSVVHMQMYAETAIRFFTDPGHWSRLHPLSLRRLSSTFVSFAILRRDNSPNEEESVQISRIVSEIHINETRRFSLSGNALRIPC